jgi:hypothetical protein
MTKMVVTFKFLRKWYYGARLEESDRVRHVARMEKLKNSYTILIGRRAVRDPLGKYFRR